MPRVQFIGRIFPQAFSVSLPGRDVTWEDGPGQTGLKATFRIRVANSFVNVEVDTNRYDSTDASELYKQVYDLVRASVNLVAFATGHGLFVLIDTLIDPDGIPTMILPQDPSLSAHCTVFSLSPNDKRVDEIYNMVLADQFLFKNLNDLAEVLWMPHVSPVNCGRVIEGIRRMISPRLDGADAWQAMHKALNIDKNYQQWISKKSTGPRHSDPTFIPGATTGEIAQRTWAIMNRYLEYRKRGNAPLKAPEFPLLA